MARRPLIAPQFERARDRLAVIAGTDEAKAIARSMLVLADTDELPFVGDEQLLLPPALWAWRHAVPRTQLALIYAFDAETVTFISLRRQR